MNKETGKEIPTKKDPYSPIPEHDPIPSKPPIIEPGEAKPKHSA